MPRFKNISKEDRRVGRADGPLVEADKVTIADGEVIGILDDAWVTGDPDTDVERDPETKQVVGFTGDARAWPKATWELLDEPKSTKDGD